MRALLDTCTFLWLATGRPMPDRTRAILEAAGSDVVISTASVWEIAIKHGRGRLALPVPPPQFVPAARARYGIDLLPIDEESALHVAKLPDLHRDPFDRMLVSQAIVHGLTILTPDPLVTQYPARTMWE
jgi:PIN domain nuclease of toxin-antitoxin system